MPSITELSPSTCSANAFKNITLPRADYRFRSSPGPTISAPIRPPSSDRTLALATPVTSRIGRLEPTGRRWRVAGRMPTWAMYGWSSPITNRARFPSRVLLRQTMADSDHVPASPSWRLPSWAPRLARPTRMSRRTAASD